MLVGPAGGGKTTNYNVLLKSLANLENEGFAKVVAK